MSYRLLRPTLSALLLAGATLAAPLEAAVLLVTKTADTADGACDVDCSLREAIIAANATPEADTVILGAHTYTLTRVGANENLSTSGDLDIASDVAVVGAGAHATIIAADHADRVFDVRPNARLDLVGLTVEGGSASGHGGGVLVDSEVAELALRGVELARNQASGSGGGIYLAGTATIEASTLAENLAAGGNGGGLLVAGTGSAELVNSTLYANEAAIGGGLYSEENGEATLTETTIHANDAAVRGGGVVGISTPFLSFSVPVFTRSIVAGNTAATDPDCSGNVKSNGDTLVGIACAGFDDGPGDLLGSSGTPLPAGLGAFGDQGGPTNTVALLADSPAVDAAATCAATDQRGVVRPVDAGCDLGAFELTTACVNDGQRLCLLDGRFAVSVDFATAQGASGAGRADLLSDESGTFWFFRPENRELFVKVLDACTQFDRFWVFASGLTNVAVTLTVVDTATGETKVYENPQGEAFAPQLDTDAFATCN
jgi:CSLREA domain-containing protein